MLSISGGRPACAWSTAVQRNAGAQREGQAWTAELGHSDFAPPATWPRCGRPCGHGRHCGHCGHWRWAPLSLQCLLCTGLFRASATLNPPSSAGGLRVSLTWSFVVLPSRSLSRVLLSPLRTAARPWTASPPLPPLSPVRCARRHHGPPLDPGSCELPVPARGTPLHYAPQLRRHTSFAATSTPDGRQNHRHLRTPDPGSSTPTRACPR